MLAPAAAVVAADQGTKLWALSRLAGHQAIVLPGGWVELRLISNPGAAFSFGSGATWVFTLCATAAVAIVPRVRCPGPVPGPGDSTGTAAGRRGGQPADRLFRAPGPGVGRVVNFIDCHGWFVGNVADIAIVASAGILIMRAMTDPGREHRVPIARPGRAGHP